MQELVSFHSEGQRIYANFYIASDDAPCILMSHGLEGSKDGDKWLVLSSRFASGGFSTFRFNYRGCGEGVERSEGDFEATSLTGRIRDYKAALDYIQDAGVTSERIGVIGSSFGGMIALAAKDTRVRAMVILATPYRFPSSLGKESLDRQGYSIIPSGRRISTDINKDVEAYDLCSDVAQVGCPILIIHGSADEVVPTEHAHQLYHHANDPKRLEIIKGANHALDASDHLEQLTTLSFEWLNKYL